MSKLSHPAFKFALSDLCVLHIRFVFVFVPFPAFVSFVVALASAFRAIGIEEVVVIFPSAYRLRGSLGIEAALDGVVRVIGGRRLRFDGLVSIAVDIFGLSPTHFRLRTSSPPLGARRAL